MLPSVERAENCLYKQRSPQRQGEAEFEGSPQINVRSEQVFGPLHRR